MEEEAIHKNKDSAKTLNKRTGGKNCLTKSITKMDKLIAKSLATTTTFEAARLFKKLQRRAPSGAAD